MGCSSYSRTIYRIDCDGKNKTKCGQITGCTFHTFEGTEDGECLQEFRQKYEAEGNDELPDCAGAGKNQAQCEKLQDKGCIFDEKDGCVYPYVPLDGDGGIQIAGASTQQLHERRLAERQSK